MPSRAELELRARMCNINPASYPNDSKLEQIVVYTEKTAAAGAGTIGSAASATAVAGVSGGANV